MVVPCCPASPLVVVVMHSTPAIFLNLLPSPLGTALVPDHSTGHFKPVVAGMGGAAFAAARLENLELVVAVAHRFVDC